VRAPFRVGARAFAECGRRDQGTAKHQQINGIKERGHYVDRLPLSAIARVFRLARVRNRGAYRVAAAGLQEGAASTGAAGGPMTGGRRRATLAGLYERLEGPLCFLAACACILIAFIIAGLR
jgi:hypothetical protein